MHLLPLRQVRLQGTTGRFGGIRCGNRRRSVFVAQFTTFANHLGEAKAQSEHSHEPVPGAFLGDDLAEVARQQGRIAARRPRTPLFGHREVRRQRREQTQGAHVDAPLHPSRRGRQQKVVGAPGGVIDQVVGLAVGTRVSEVHHRIDIRDQIVGCRTRFQRFLPPDPPHLMALRKPVRNGARERAVGIRYQNVHSASCRRVVANPCSPTSV